MVEPHESGIVGRLGKRLAPFLSCVFNRRPLSGIVRLAETYLAIIRGKGGGTGWDIAAEVKTAAGCVTRSDPVIFDIGANRGDWSLKLKERLSGGNARFFLVEPSPTCVEILRSLDLGNATVIEAAVGEEPGTANLFTPADGSPIASIHPRKDSYFQKCEFSSEEIAVTTIDSIVEEHSIETVDFMKLDIEGNELAALKGASKSLKTGRIKALAFEFGSGNINSRTYFRDFWDLLAPLGYEIKRICPGGMLEKIDRYYEDAEYFRGVTNYVARLKQPGESKRQSEI